MYDVIAIGGGPGGYAAAIRAAQLGGKVAVVEAAEIGGTCVNRGCIPSKIWLKAAQLKNSIQKAASFGINASLSNVDLSVIVERKNGAASDIRMGMNSLLNNNKIDIIKGKGRIISTDSVDVDGKILNAKNIIIATGTSSAKPDISGIESALMSTDEVLDMMEIPASMLIYGSGFIEVEMAGLLNAFGAKVVLAFEEARILPREDGDTSQRIGSALRKQGIEIIPRANLQSVDSANGIFTAHLTGKKDHDVGVSRVLVPLRVPNTKDMGLEQIGITVDQEGFIKVDDNLQTNINGIYAIGDVTGGWMVSHAATSMGIVAAENAMGKESTFSPAHVPRCIYTSPEAASVGMSEEVAEEQGYNVETGVFPMSINGLAISYDELDGAVKIVSNDEYGEILGIHITGSRATELIWGAVLAMDMEATLEEVARTITVHPTFSESIAMAAQDAMGWALYLPKR